MRYLIAGLMLTVMVGGFQELRVRGLQADIAAKDKAITQLEAAIEQQNAANEALAKDSALETAKSETRVTRVFVEAERKKARLPAGYGPKVMNDWFTEAFQ